NSLTCKQSTLQKEKSMKRNDWKTLCNLALLLSSLALPSTAGLAQASWTPLRPGETLPAPRVFHAMSTWGTRGVILFGGNTNSPSVDLNDTWVWNGITWTNLPQTAP